MEIQQGGGTGGGGTSLTVTDTITTVTNTSEITFVGATVSNGGGGNAIVTITASGVAIGGTVTNGNAGRVLFVNPAGILAQSDDFIYGPTSTTFQVGFASTNYLEIKGGASKTHRLGSSAGTNITINETSKLVQILSGGNPYLYMDVTNGIYQFGDITPAGNGTKILVNDSTKTITSVADVQFYVTDASANPWLDIRPGSKIIQMGDIGVTANGTTIVLTDSTSSYAFNKRNITIGSLAYVFPSSVSGVTFLRNDGSNNLTWASAPAATLTVGSTTISSGTTTRILYDNAGTLGEYTITGTGTVVAMATAPTFVTSITTPAVLATANDSGAIGSATTSFSDLFLAEGGVINWDNGDATLTQSGNTLTVAGAEFIIDDASGPTSTVAAGFRGIPQNSKSADYTLVLSDAGKHIYHPSADTTARTWTIPANGSVAYPIGTTLTFINDTSGGVITLAITTDTLVWQPTGGTGSRSIAANGSATAVKVTSTRWTLTGVGIT